MSDISKYVQGKKAGPGIIVKNNDNSLGTDLVAWNKFKVMLDKSFNGGTIFSKEVVSTYGLYVDNDGYTGGVLAPNGDIHFVPWGASVGQKISSSGVVSTYSYIQGADNYMGGVLASNGDIHFIPQNRLGQKISIDGTISTYSLVYTRLDAYVGGVLAPNGDIHFIPYCASVGQKVSSSGVVSTYSLAYAGDYMYRGGVLASNGDIHFITLQAYLGIGQKVSTLPAIPFSQTVCQSPFFNKF